MSSAMDAVDQIPVALQHLTLQDEEEKSKAEIQELGIGNERREAEKEEKGTESQPREVENEEKGFGNHSGFCAICLDKIKLEEIALVKGCEHAYCVTCILHWATYSKNPTCPQCKYPFEFLNVHRSLDGSINDYMLEESVCLLLRAQWFTPLTVLERENAYDEAEDYFPYEEEYCDDGDDLDEEEFYGSSSSVRIGNRRWGDNGYVRAGRQQARPVSRSNFQDPGAGSSSCQPRQKEASKDKTGRRAKRALKREAADKAAAAKHEQHLARFGRK